MMMIGKVSFQGVTFPIPHTDSLTRSGSVPSGAAICHPFFWVRKPQKRAELQW